MFYFIFSTGFKFQLLFTQSINYVSEFENENQPEIGYWVFTPTLIAEENKCLAYEDSIASKCLYTMLFLASRENADFLIPGSQNLAVTDR